MKIETKGLLYLLVLLSAFGISCSFSTANIENAQMAKDVKPDTKEPINITNTFETTDKVIHCVVKLANAPDDTKLKARWIAVKAEGVDPNYKIAETDITAGSSNVDFNLTPSGPGLPPGDYKVEVYLNPDTDKGKTPAREVSFSIKASPAPAPPSTPEPAEPEEAP